MKGGWNRSGGLENFSEVDRRGRTIIQFSRVDSYMRGFTVS